MAIKFQYNKTALQSLNKQLNMRTKALPTIKSKEAALRMEVKKAKAEVEELEKLLKQKIDSGIINKKMWTEFNSNLVTVSSIQTSFKKIAGVQIPLLKEVEFNVKEFSLFEKPKWYAEGIEFLKELIKLTVEIEISGKRMELLSHARRKTTQKVNLYEKIQIPGYQNAILKIKRFLEDEENLSKSAQKIVKNRQQQAMEEQV